MALKLKGSTSGFVAIDCAAEGGNNTLILPSDNGVAGAIWANNVDTAGVATCTSITINKNGDLTVPGTVSVGGTITYEDVTNVDAVGIITARQSVHISDSLRHLGDLTTRIRFPAANTVTVETDGTERARITGIGSFGIGTNDPETKLDVRGNIYFANNMLVSNWDGSGVGGSNIDHIWHSDASNNGTGGTWNFVSDGTAKQVGDSAIQIGYLKSSGGGHLLGSVGIGTTNPTAPLVVRSSDNTLGILTSTDSGANLDIYDDDTQGRIRTVDGRLHLYADFNSAVADSAIRFFVDGDSNEKLRITAAGRVGIGTETPSSMIEVAGATPQIRSTDTDAANDYSVFQNSSGSSVYNAVDGGSGGAHIFQANGTEKVRIASDGKLLVDHTTSVGSGKLQVFTKTADALDILSFDDTAADGGRLTFYRNRNTTYGSNTKLADDDSLGRIDFRGMNTEGTDNYEIGASIRAEVDGTPGSGSDASDMPGRLMFLTTPDGSDSPEERVRILSNGNIGIGTDNPSQMLTIRGTILKTRSDSGLGLIYLQNDGSQNGQILINQNGGTTRVKLDSASDSYFNGGKLLIGTTSSVDVASTAPARLQVEHSSGSLSIACYSIVDASGPSGVLALGHGRGSASGVLQDEDLLGQIRFAGGDGTDMETQGATINAEVDGTPGSNDMPTALVFSTNSGTSSTTERMRIHADGAFCVGTVNKSLYNDNGSGSSGLVMNSAKYTQCARWQGTPLFVNRMSSDGVLLWFGESGVKVGDITVSGSTVSYNAFLGTHKGRLSDGSKPTILPGTILENINQTIEWKTATISNVGSASSTVVIPYYGVKTSGVDTVSYGGASYTGAVVGFSSSYQPKGDNKHVCVKVSDTASSKSVGGVFVSWDDSINDAKDNGLDESYNDLSVGGVGNFFIRIKSGETIANGDLVESNGDGTGKVQSDDIIRSKTVGKITSTNVIKTYDDGSFLVTAVLYAG